MSSNGKNGHAKNAEFPQPEPSAPTTPQIMGGIKLKTTKEYKYYLSVKWDVFWDEFAFSIDERGRLVHRSIRTFAKAKAKEDWQRSVIITACGARPDPEQVKRLKVPWLGDWQKRRSLGFWSLEDPAKVESLQTAIKERKDSFEAVQALAPNIASQIEYFTRINQDIARAFGGQVLLDAHSPTHDINQKRFKTWLRMQTDIWGLMKDAFNEWYKLFGVPQLDAGNWMKMLAAGAAGASFGATRGALQPQGPQVAPQSIILPEGVTPTHLLVAQTIVGKCADFGMQIPTESVKISPSKSDIKGEPVNGKEKSEKTVKH